MHTQSIGAQGEEIVTNWLLCQGCRILDRNIWFSFGEIDILAKSPRDEIILVEVKARTSESFGLPHEAVTPLKKLRLLRCLKAIQQQYPESSLRFLIAEVVNGRLKKVYQDTLDS